MADANPAREAARSPERSEVDPVVHAIGVGPGDPAVLTNRAHQILDETDVVVGFETVVDVIRDETSADCLACGYDDEAETLARFGERVAAGEHGVAVLMGDPNVSGYQFLGRVERAVDGPVQVVPGVSSIQIAASRTRTPLEHATVVSLHRRGSLEEQLDRLVAAARGRHLLCLPRPYDWMPGEIAAHLVDHGVPGDRTALVCERLTLADERVTATTLADLATEAGGDEPTDSRFSDLAVLVVRAADPIPVSDAGTEETA